MGLEDPVLQEYVDLLRLENAELRRRRYEMGAAQAGGSRRYGWRQALDVTMIAIIFLTFVLTMRYSMDELRKEMEQQPHSPEIREAKPQALATIPSAPAPVAHAAASQPTAAP